MDERAPELVIFVGVRGGEVEPEGFDEIRSVRTDPQRGTELVRVHPPAM
jgi:hypothetical protein